MLSSAWTKDFSSACCVQFFLDQGFCLTSRLCAGLQQLPPELVLAISTFITNRRDVRAFAGTNRSVRNAIGEHERNRLRTTWRWLDLKRIVRIHRVQKLFWSIVDDTVSQLPDETQTEMRMEIQTKSFMFLRWMLRGERPARLISEQHLRSGFLKICISALFHRATSEETCTTQAFRDVADDIDGYMSISSGSNLQLWCPLQDLFPVIRLIRLLVRRNTVHAHAVLLLILMTSCVPTYAEIRELL